MKKKLTKCIENYCEDPPVSMGLCKKHADERDKKNEDRKDALNLLHRYQVDDIQFDVPEIKAELHQMRDYFHNSCDAQNNRKDYGVITQDEAQDAFEWCVAYAKIAVDAIREYRKEGKIPERYFSNAEWIRDRFKNLEAGLRSNGTPKHDNNRK